MTTETTNQIDNLSDIELKAIAFDSINTVEIHKNNLKIINDELVKRAQKASTTMSGSGTGPLPKPPSPSENGIQEAEVVEQS